MKSFFPQWIEYRRNESSVKEKTIKENGFLWNRHLESSGFVLKPLNAVSAPDCIAFFRSITKGRKMTRKRFNDLKSVMNGIFFYAVERGIISHNPLLEINYRQFSYKPENRIIVPYTEEERQQILDYLPDNDLYSLAIKLFFCLPIRIGELKGLCFSDIDNYGNIHIERFVNDKNQIENDIKGHTSSGIRWIPLSSTASNYIEHIRYINPHSDFLFMKNGKFITTVTFNRHLRACCESLGIQYRPSHKIRFSVITMLHKHGMTLQQIRPFAGHTKDSMTEHYVREYLSYEQSAPQLKAILN